MSDGELSKQFESKNIEESKIVENKPIANPDNITLQELNQHEIDKNRDIDELDDLLSDMQDISGGQISLVKKVASVEASREKTSTEETSNVGELITKESTEEASKEENSKIDIDKITGKPVVYYRRKKDEVDQKVTKEENKAGAEVPKSQTAKSQITKETNAPKGNKKKKKNKKTANTNLDGLNSDLKEARKVLATLNAENEKEEKLREKEKEEKRKERTLKKRAANAEKKDDVESATDQAENSDEDEVKATPEELKARMRERIKSSRQGRIQQIRKGLKEKSYPLTPIYYCDAEGCSAIGDKFPGCPRCECFFYCSKACQIKDWTKHKLMCGKEPTEEYKSKLVQYTNARNAANAMYDHFKIGNYITVIHEPGDVPAAMFASINEKSNVLFWKRYIENPLFSTTSLDAVGSLAYKVDAALKQYPTNKVYMIVVLLDRLKDGVATECIIRLYIADGFGETMAAPNGKVMKPVMKYVRKGK